MGQAVTVRERIQAIHQQQLRGDFTPSQGALWLATLGALTGNVLTEIREAEAEYNEIYASWLDKEEKANRAKIRAEMTSEYKRLREARDLMKQVEHQMATLKYLLRVEEAVLKGTRG